MFLSKDSGNTSPSTAENVSKCGIHLGVSQIWGTKKSGILLESYNISPCLLPLLDDFQLPRKWSGIPPWLSAHSMTPRVKNCRKREYTWQAQPTWCLMGEVTSMSDFNRVLRILNIQTKPQFRYVKIWGERDDYIIVHSRVYTKSAVPKSDNTFLVGCSIPTQKRLHRFQPYDFQPATH